jgi:hypothetical protein
MKPKIDNTYIFRFLYSHEVVVNADNQDDAYEKALEKNPSSILDLTYEGCDEDNTEIMRRLA